MIAQRQLNISEKRCLSLPFDISININQEHHLKLYLNKESSYFWEKIDFFWKVSIKIKILKITFFQHFQSNLTHKAHPKTLTMQVKLGESHLTVTVPSASLSQKQDPLRISPQSIFCMMIQFEINLKFLFLAVTTLKIFA